MSGYAERHGQSSNIQWGRIVSGAAVATGVVLVGLAIGGGEVPILSDIADGVKQVVTNVLGGLSSLFAGSGAPDSSFIKLDEDPSVFAALGTFMGKVGTFLADNSKFLGGAALLGGGLGYMSSHPAADAVSSDAVPAPAVANARLQNAQMGYAAREQMRAVNAIMESRMQAFGANGRQV